VTNIKSHLLKISKNYRQQLARRDAIELQLEQHSDRANIFTKTTAASARFGKWYASSITIQVPKDGYPDEPR